MLSRVADAIHWMSRYIERAENTARFVGVNESLTLDLPGDTGHQWRSLVLATGDDELFLKRYGHFDRPNVIRFLTLDPDYPNSIWSCIRAARENARGVREIISSDMWEETNRAYLFVKKTAEAPERILADPEPFLQSIKTACYRIHGATQVTMTHNDAWLFMEIGRLLERADKTSRILDVKYVLLLPDSENELSADDELYWSALLQSVSGLEMYRQQCGRLEPARVVEFLLLDHKFPRAIRHCVEIAENAVRAVDIGGRRLLHPRNEVETRLGRLRAELEFAEVNEILSQGLHEWVDDFQKKLNVVGTAMHKTFFQLGGSSQSQSQSAG